VQTIDRKFLSHPKRYVFQTALATGTLAAVLVIGGALSNVAIITAIAASAFLVFIGPDQRLAQPRRVIGGHLTGCLAGLAGALALGLIHDHVSGAAFVDEVIAAIAVGAGIIAMGMSDTEHPPAAGTVLGLVLGAHAIESAVVLMLAILMIHAARQLLRPWLVDLL
jgi:CBS-domain-containing membrane protein